MKKNQAKVSIITLGCPKNLVDSEKLAANLRDNGMDTAHEQELAETVIINTCAFIGDAQQEAVDTILQYLEWKKEGLIQKVIVTGCLSQRFGKELEKELPEVDGFFGVNDYDKLVGILSHKSQFGHSRMLATPEHYAYLKIAEGCDHQCSFCIIPAIRGKYKSRPFEEIIEEAKELAAQGVKELIVIAQDTTYYGIDLYKKHRIAELMDTLAQIDGFNWIRLMYAYPLAFPPDLANVIARNPKIVKYLDMPLQHIDEEILTDMQRPVFEKEIGELIASLRAQIPDLHIRSAFIAGYPGETPKKFNALREFLKKIKFERLGIFAYSPEIDTPAGEKEKQVSEKLRLSRAAELITLHEKNSVEYSKTMVGKTLDVMIDEVTENNTANGRTQWDAPEIDHIVFIDNAGNVKPGDIVKVKITASGPFDISGQRV